VLVLGVKGWPPSDNSNVLVHHEEKVSWASHFLTASKEEFIGVDVQIVYTVFRVDTLKLRIFDVNKIH
jgi:hypothetical protein